MPDRPFSVIHLSSSLSLIFLPLRRLLLPLSFLCFFFFSRFHFTETLNFSPFCSTSTVLKENLDGHLRRCPLLKQVHSLSLQPFYQKGINAGTDDDDDDGGGGGGGGETHGNKEQMVRPRGVKDFFPSNNSSSGPVGCGVSSEAKRIAVYSMTATELCALIGKIQSVHASICRDIRESYRIPKACGAWINRQVDGKLPFQEKHVLQQSSILGNLEEFGVLKNFNGEISRDCHLFDVPFDDGANVPAVVEFGAGRGYLTQVLADCYGIKQVFLVERKAYKFKADRSLRQKESLKLERLRIDIEDLKLNAVEALQGIPYLAIGKHLCGPATDMTLRCCLAEHHNQGPAAQGNGNAGCHLRGLAIATCCHHICQWKHYINKKYLSDLGITKEDFHAITWFTSWAVDAAHDSDLSAAVNYNSAQQIIGEDDDAHGGVEEMFRKMSGVERAVLGFMCKDIIDMGRLMWMKELGLDDAALLKYIPFHISPENRMLIARV